MNFKELFQYTPSQEYNFNLSKANSSNKQNDETSQNIYPDINSNLKHIQTKYNTPINSDIMIRQFSLTAQNLRL